MEQKQLDDDSYFSEEFVDEPIEEVRVEAARKPEARKPENKAKSENKANERNAEWKNTAKLQPTRSKIVAKVSKETLKTKELASKAKPKEAKVLFREKAPGEKRGI